MKRGAERVDKERNGGERSPWEKERETHLDEEKQTKGTKVRCTRDQKKDTNFSDNKADRVTYKMV